MYESEFYENLTQVLTWYENPDEYPWELGVSRSIDERMYNLLVDIQNMMDRGELVFKKPEN